jgi:hypothetical protein
MKNNDYYEGFLAGSVVGIIAASSAIYVIVNLLT